MLFFATQWQLILNIEILSRKGEIRALPTVAVPEISCSLFASRNFDRCHSFLLPYSATGGGRKRPSLDFVSRLRISSAKQKSTSFDVLFLAEKERFELSRPVKAYTISNRARSTSYATSPCRLLTWLFYHNKKQKSIPFLNFFKKILPSLIFP